MSDALQKVKASKEKSARNRDNWKARALRADELLRRVISNPSDLLPGIDWLQRLYTDSKLCEEIRSHLNTAVDRT